MRKRFYHERVCSCSPVEGMKFIEARMLVREVRQRHHLLVRILQEGERRSHCPTDHRSHLPRRTGRSAATGTGLLQLLGGLRSYRAGSLLYS